MSGSTVLALVLTASLLLLLLLLPPLLLLLLLLPPVHCRVQHVHCRLPVPRGGPLVSGIGPTVPAITCGWARMHWEACAFMRACVHTRMHTHTC